MCQCFSETARASGPPTTGYFRTLLPIYRALTRRGRSVVPPIRVLAGPPAVGPPVRQLETQALSAWAQPPTLDRAAPDQRATSARAAPDQPVTLARAAPAQPALARAAPAQVRAAVL